MRGGVESTRTLFRRLFLHAKICFEVSKFVTFPNSLWTFRKSRKFFGVFHSVLRWSRRCGLIQPPRSQATSTSPALLGLKTNIQKYSYKNIRIIFGFENCHESNTDINIRGKIFEYSFVHWFRCHPGILCKQPFWKLLLILWKYIFLSTYLMVINGWFFLSILREWNLNFKKVIQHLRVYLWLLTI